MFGKIDMYLSILFSKYSTLLQLPWVVVKIKYSDTGQLRLPPVSSNNTYQIILFYFV